jgi:hypothetical protein
VKAVRKPGGPPSETEKEWAAAFGVCALVLGDVAGIAIPAVAIWSNRRRESFMMISPEVACVPPNRKHILYLGLPSQAEPRARPMWISQIRRSHEEVVRKKMQKLNYSRAVQDRDKVTRMSVASAMFEAGQVHFPELALWLAELEAELFAFPGSRHDDQVDSICRVL